MLINNRRLYEDLTNTLRRAYSYVQVHAIYIDLHEDCGSTYRTARAAVDLYEPGRTYHVWFVVNDDNSIIIDRLERWFMG